jgi:hypothetical protein
MTNELHTFKELRAAIARAATVYALVDIGGEMIRFRISKEQAMAGLRGHFGAIDAVTGATRATEHDDHVLIG